MEDNFLPAINWLGREIPKLTSGYLGILEMCQLWKVVTNFDFRKLFCKF